MKSITCKIAAVLFVTGLLLTIPFVAYAASDNVIAEIAQGLSIDNALWQECPVGDYIADAVRHESGAEVALVPAGLLKNALVGDGQVTEEDVADLLWEDKAVYVYTLSVPQLKTLLEDSVSHWTLSVQERIDGEESAYSGFLQVSGMSVKADATAPVGSRILSISLNGMDLDLADESTVITTAVPQMLDGGMEGILSEKTMEEMLLSYISAQELVELTETDRIEVIGAHARDIISVIPGWFFWFMLIIIAGTNIITGSRKNYTDNI